MSNFKKWITALLIAALVIIVLCGAISALADLASRHEVTAGIVFFGLIILGVAALIKQRL
jgi:hypothetical protein